jgi:hypothetical protein
MLKALQDAAIVATDVLAVGAYFSDVPQGLLQLGKDAVSAVLHRDAVGLSAVIDEASSLFAAVKGDVGNAQPAIDKLTADLKQFLADLQ